MNRYIEQGITKDAEAGRSVIVVDSQGELRATFDAIRADVPDGATVYAGNGAERIDYPSGGTIRFLGRSRGVRFRGMSADVAFVRGWEHLSDRERDEILPVGHELIRA